MGNVISSWGRRCKSANSGKAGGLPEMERLKASLPFVEASYNLGPKQRQGLPTLEPGPKTSSLLQISEERAFPPHRPCPTLRGLGPRQRLASLDWQSGVGHPQARPAFAPAGQRQAPPPAGGSEAGPGFLSFCLAKSGLFLAHFAVPDSPPELPRFHPQTPIRDWGKGHAFRLADALTGVCVFGATGSGKTSGPAKHLAYGYLAGQFGGLVLCAKKEERQQWQQWAAECRRTDDLVIVDSTGKWRFNFLEWEASRPDASGGLTINIVAILDEIAGAIAKLSGRAKSGGATNKFCEDAIHHLNTNLVELPLFGGVHFSL